MNPSQNKESIQLDRENELKQLYQSEREQRALAEALFDVAEALNSTLKLDEVLNRILVNVGHVVPHDAANIMLIENGVCQVVRMHGYHELGIEDAISKLKFNVADIPNFLYMAETGQPLSIEDTSIFPGWVSFPVTSWVHSYAGAPIRVNGQTAGFLNLDSTRPGFYSQVLAQRLMAFANQAGVAIHNARLFEQVQQLAITDDLTGLYNRRGLNELGQREIERAIRFSHPLSVLMMDIDDFKAVNDKYSYQVGDEVLKSFAARLQNKVREVDILGRFGGDEFIIFLVENDLQVANQVAERLRKTIRDNPFPTSQGELNLTASIGVTAFSMDIANLSTLYDKAGLALHAAKQGGKNQISIQTSPEGGEPA